MAGDSKPSTYFFDGVDASSEEDSKRSGFLSYAGETHALALGLSTGFAAGSAGDVQMVASLVAAAIFGNRGKDVIDPKLRKNVQKEAPYAVGGAVAGYLLGRIAVGKDASLAPLVDALGGVVGL